MVVRISILQDQFILFKNNHSLRAVCWEIRVYFVFSKALNTTPYPKFPINSVNSAENLQLNFQDSLFYSFNFIGVISFSFNNAL